MFKLIGKFVINAGALWLATQLFPGMIAFAGLQTLLAVAAALAILNVIF